MIIWITIIIKYDYLNYNKNNQPIQIPVFLSSS
jgi:hypothetical protein